MSMTTVTVKKLVIPTYQEAPAEQLPMFAENRVHQRFTGNPYPNAVVIIRRITTTSSTVSTLSSPR